MGAAYGGLGGGGGGDGSGSGSDGGSGSGSGGERPGGAGESRPGRGPRTGGSRTRKSSGVVRVSIWMSMHARTRDARMDGLGGGAKQLPHAALAAPRQTSSIFDSSVSDRRSRQCHVCIDMRIHTSHTTPSRCFVT